MVILYQWRRVNSNDDDGDNDNDDDGGDDDDDDDDVDEDDDDVLLIRCISKAQYAITCSTILSLLTSVSSMFLSKHYLRYKLYYFK